MEKIFKFVLLIAIMVLAPVNICVGQALVKYKIHCSDVNKRSETTDKIIVEYEKDILTVNVYKNRVTLSSEKFDKTIQFNNYCRHIKDNNIVFEDEHGREIKGIRDIFYSSYNHFILYTRAKESLVKPALLLYVKDGYYYNFNISYGEIYDPTTKKWIIGNAAVASSYENDKVRTRLRKDLGELCSDFEYELHERLAIGDDYDPWDQ